MPIKPLFFDMLNHRGGGFDDYLAASTAGADYLTYRDIVVPFDYGDAEREYAAIRNGCGLFDGCMSSVYRLTGPGSGAFLDAMLTRPASGIPANRAIYGLLCNADGHVRDDAIAYKLSEDDYLFMPTRVSTGQDMEKAAAGSGGGFRFTDISQKLVGLFFQGPQSAAILGRMGFGGVETLKRFELASFDAAGSPVIIARIGYTGDLGFECWFDPRLTGFFEQGVAAAREAGFHMLGYGVSAMQACRLEVGLVSPGREFDIQGEAAPDLLRSPFDLGLDWVVKFDGRAFVGESALAARKQEQASRALRSFMFDGPLRADMPATLYLRNPDQPIEIGRITSSAWSWGLSRVVGLATIDSRFADEAGARIPFGDAWVDVHLTKGPLLHLPHSHAVPAQLREP